MKKFFPIVLLSAALNSSAQTNYPGNIPGCVARYNFSTGGSSSILPDVSNNNNTGLMHNMTPTTGWRGFANTAMQFNGTSSYANVASNSLLTPQVITLVALVKFDAFYSGTCQGNMIISKGTIPNPNPGNYTLQVHDQSYDQDCNAFNPNEEMPAGFMGNASYGSVPLTTPIQTGKWYFLALSFDGSKADCYQVAMDPLVLATNIQPIWSVSTPSNAIGTNTLDLTIGNQISTTYPYWFNGAMDEVAIFNRKLTNTEMQSVYTYLWQQPTAVSTIKPSANNITASAQNGMLSLQSSDGEAIGEVGLYTLTGQELSRTKFSTSAAAIDISSLPRQMLFAKVLHKGIMNTLKVTNL